jgi:endo-1,4-beta-xylanase
MKFVLTASSLLTIAALFMLQNKSGEISFYSGCNSTGKDSMKENTLKAAFKNDFLIGTALNSSQIEEKDTGAFILVPRQFNAITPENVMKCEVIHPEWDRYNFDLPDKLVSYGKKHNMFITGHTLVWHSQLAPFVNQIKSSDSLRQFLVNHIRTIAGRYAGKVDSWDVVNEALNEDGTLRKSIFLEKLGEDYLPMAFDLAARAAPNTELYYNDYNIEQPLKRAGTIALIKKIRATGARVDGVGIQGHWSINGPPLRDIENSILEFSALGLKISFTELDLTALPNPWDLKGADVNQNFEGSPYMNPYPKNLPDSMQSKLAKGYQDLFKLFIRHKDKIDRITFWGVNDGQSWLNNWPIKGRTNYPLLFDRNFLPKPAFESVMALVQSK